MYYKQIPIVHASHVNYVYMFFVLFMYFCTNVCMINKQ